MLSKIARMTPGCMSPRDPSSRMTGIEFELFAHHDFGELFDEVKAEPELAPLLELNSSRSRCPLEIECNKANHTANDEMQTKLFITHLHN